LTLVARLLAWALDAQQLDFAEAHSDLADVFTVELHVEVALTFSVQVEPEVLVWQSGPANTAGAIANAPRVRDNTSFFIIKL
jgi:hypothetical protein